MIKYTRNKTLILLLFISLVFLMANYLISHHNAASSLRKVLKNGIEVLRVSENTLFTKDVNNLYTQKRYKRKSRNPNSDEGRELMASNNLDIYQIKERA